MKWHLNNVTEQAKENAKGKVQGGAKPRKEHAKTEQGTGIDK
jgi:hypothetical protein